MKRLLLASAALCLLFPTTLPAQESAVPSQINYQGRVTDENGTPFTGYQRIWFSVYNAPNGGTRLWGPQMRESVWFADGYFNEVLGTEYDPTLSETFVQPVLYIGLALDANGNGTLDGVEEILPRQRILAAPYAATAERVRGHNLEVDAGQITVYGGGTINTHGGSFNLYVGGNQRSKLGADLSLWSPSGTLRSKLWTDGLSLHDESDHLRTELNQDSLQLYNTGGTAWAGLVQGGSWVWNGFRVRDTTNTQKIRLRVREDDGSGEFQAGSGDLSVYSSLQEPLAYIGPNTADGNTAGGRVQVYDRFGNAIAGMRPHDTVPGWGVVWGYQKSFVVDHPAKTAEKSKIVYISLEGPEGAVFFRGKARLKNGSATIALPEHFTLLVEQDSITVNLTPHSLDSKGVAVGSISEGQVTIGELAEGKGNYEVSYTILATRSGLKDHNPVLSEAEYVRRFGANDIDALER